jgi:hypothetical protein
MTQNSRFEFRMPADLHNAISTLAATTAADAGVVLSVADIVRLAIRRAIDNPALLFRPPSAEARP